jgi:hypothetical protein
MFVYSRWFATSLGWSDLESELNRLRPYIPALAGDTSSIWDIPLSVAEIPTLWTLGPREQRTEVHRQRLLALRLVDGQLYQTIVGVVSPIASANEFLIQQLTAAFRDRAATTRLTPTLQPFGPLRDDVTVSGVRYSGAGSEISAFFPPGLGIDSGLDRIFGALIFLPPLVLDGMAISYGQTIVTVLQDGEILIHDTPPDQIASIMTVIGSVVWPEFRIAEI